MNSDSIIEAVDYLGVGTLIIGEVNTGKTTLTSKILAAICATGWGRETAVVDLAPVMPSEIIRPGAPKGVGGRLVPPDHAGVLYLRTDLRPPRLSSRTEAEAWEAARRNAELIDPLWARFESSGREVLFINDLSMYLQAGDADVLMGVLERAGTVVANGYLGQKLGVGALSVREHSEMEKLTNHFTRVIRLAGRAGAAEISSDGGLS